jgi:16S rRNA (guanine527-N7)-methyltransferase
MFREIRTPDDFKQQFDVSRETIEKLEIYCELLRQWQRTINLVAPKSVDSAWHRHFADSAQLLPHVPADARSLVDFGSGAGFPGLVLAILLSERSNAPSVTLVESDQRKCAFLREVARSVDNPVRILSTRIEGSATSQELGAADVISARALAPLERLFRLSVPFCHPATVCVFPKGRSAAEEIRDARASWQFEAELFASQTDDEGQIVVATGVAPLG